jgi:hypothetical protein
LFPDFGLFRVGFFQTLVYYSELVFSEFCITAIQGDSILLTWDVSNDIYKVLYVVQMKTVEDTKWKIFKGEV